MEEASTPPVVCIDSSNTIVPLTRIGAPLAPVVVVLLLLFLESVMPAEAGLPGRGGPLWRDGEVAGGSLGVALRRACTRAVRVETSWAESSSAGEMADAEGTRGRLPAFAVATIPAPELPMVDELLLLKPLLRAGGKAKCIDSPLFLSRNPPSSLSLVVSPASQPIFADVPGTGVTFRALPMVADPGPGKSDANPDDTPGVPPAPPLLPVLEPDPSSMSALEYDCKARV